LDRLRCPVPVPAAVYAQVRRPGIGGSRAELDATILVPSDGHSGLGGTVDEVADVLEHGVETVNAERGELTTPVRQIAVAGSRLAVHEIHLETQHGLGRTVFAHHVEPTAGPAIKKVVLRCRSLS